MTVFRLYLRLCLKVGPAAGWQLHVFLSFATISYPTQQHVNPGITELNWTHLVSTYCHNFSDNTWEMQRMLSIISSDKLRTCGCCHSLSQFRLSLLLHWSYCYNTILTLTLNQRSRSTASKHCLDHRSTLTEYMISGYLDKISFLYTHKHLMQMRRSLQYRGRCCCMRLFQ